VNVIPNSAQLLSARDAWSVQRDWLAAFAKDPAGGQIKAPAGFMWHLFSFGHCQHVHGAKARTAFRRQILKPYFLFSEGMTDRAAVAAGPYPALEARDGDWYVVPQDYGWTYVSTHEGTEYFAERNG
jgi:hypothetical protein